MQEQHPFAILTQAVQLPPHSCLDYRWVIHMSWILCECPANVAQRAAIGWKKVLMGTDLSVKFAQAQSKQAEALVRLYDSLLGAAEVLSKLAGEELGGAQAEHLEEEAAAKVCLISGFITQCQTPHIPTQPAEL